MLQVSSVYQKGFHFRERHTEMTFSELVAMHPEIYQMFNSKLQSKENNLTHEMSLERSFFISQR